VSNYAKYPQEDPKGEKKAKRKGRDKRRKSSEEYQPKS